MKFIYILNNFTKYIFSLMRKISINLLKQMKAKLIYLVTAFSSSSSLMNIGTNYKSIPGVLGFTRIK